MDIDVVTRMDPELVLVGRKAVVFVVELLKERKKRE
jgi:hypothetical protein